MDMELSEYCEWLEDFSSEGQTINGKALEKYIIKFAEDYHKDKLKLLNISDDNKYFSLKETQEIFYAGYFHLPIDEEEEKDNGFGLSKAFEEIIKLKDEIFDESKKIIAEGPQLKKD